MNWDPTVALIVAALGLVALGLIYLLGQPRKSSQGRRVAEPGAAGRREPVLGAGEPEDRDPDAEEIEAEMARIDAALEGRAAPSGQGAASAGPRTDFERIVSLYVQAPEGQVIRGSDLVVAAEKAGLSFGAMNIFHRLVDGRPEQGPIFSVANMLKPGSFDLADLEAFETPGLSFFMTLPGPLPALDAWETMLPAAQRMAELLGAVVLDDHFNPLGRQRIAHIRDELRAWDRKREAAQSAGSW